MKNVICSETKLSVQPLSLLLSLFVSVFMAATDLISILFQWGLNWMKCCGFFHVCVHFPWRPNNAVPSLSLPLCFSADGLLKICLLWVNHTASHVRNHSSLSGLGGLISYLRTKSWQAHHHKQSDSLPSFGLGHWGYQWQGNNRKW